MIFTIDSNILVYAFEQGQHQATARRIAFGGTAFGLILTNQVIGEFFNVIRRKHPEHLEEADRAVASWLRIVPIAPTVSLDLLAAVRLAERYKLQFWDSVILTVAGSAGVDVMLSEDMGDGATYGGVKVINPFLPHNRAELDALLTPAS